MSYLFESLGDERFQQLAQALLVARFPDVQCLPVGQPDGGRDAFLRLRNAKKNGLVVFQVKYSRDPSTRDSREAIIETIRTEGAKIERLKKRGAAAYYLLSNVAGSSHLDVGSIDRANAELSESFGIPTYCWWRDDIAARININADIKWSFPEILRGTDVLQLLVEGSWKDKAASRDQALRSYIADTVPRRRRG